MHEQKTTTSISQEKRFLYIAEMHTINTYMYVVWVMLKQNMTKYKIKVPFLSSLSTAVFLIGKDK